MESKANRFSRRTLFAGLVTATAGLSLLGRFAGTPEVIKEALETIGNGTASPEKGRRSGPGGSRLRKKSAPSFSRVPSRGATPFD